MKNEITVIISVAVCVSSAAARKPKPMVQVYGTSLSTPMTGMWFHTAFLILPDGKHAHATCIEGPGTTPCAIEPFAVENRVKVPCDLLKGARQGADTVTCYQSEKYEGERNNNDITLRTARGKVAYHIDGSW